MHKVELRGGPDGVRLERAAKKHLGALREGFNSGAAAASTRWHLPRPFSTGVFDPSAVRRFVLIRNDRVIGTCRLCEPLFSGVELAIAIFDPSERGRGAGTFAVEKLCEIAFRELKTHRVELGVYTDNYAAVRVYEKCGFKREAVFRRFIHHDGKWRDLEWMSILRREWRAPRASANGGRR